MAGKKNKTYTEAIQRIEEILEQIETGDLEIDQLSGYLKEVSELITFCKNKINQTETELNKISEQTDNQN